MVVPVSRLTSRKESPSDDSWWEGLFNPLVITLISVPASIVVIATVIAIVYQCRSKSIQRYPSVPSQVCNNIIQQLCLKYIIINVIT